MNISQNNLLSSIKNHLIRISILLIFMMFFISCADIENTTSSSTNDDDGTTTNDDDDKTNNEDDKTQPTFTWFVDTLSKNSIKENSISSPIESNIKIVSELQNEVDYHLVFVDDANRSYFNKIMFSTSLNGDFENITAESLVIFNDEKNYQTIYFLPVDNHIDEVNDLTYNIKVQFKEKDIQSLGNLTVENDDVSEITLTSGTCIGIRSEVDKNCIFNVALTSQPTKNVILNYHATDDSRIASIKSTTFTPDDWNINQKVTLPITNDDIAQKANTTITIMARGTSVGSSMISFILTSDDTEGITLTSGTCTGTLWEVDKNCTFMVALANQPTEDVILNYHATDASRIASIKSTTFTPDNWNINQEVTLAITNDEMAQNEFVTVIDIISMDVSRKYYSMLSFMLQDDDNGGSDDDGDDDGVINSLDNCASVSNEDQENADGDTFGDVCDVDDDNDGLIEISSLTMLHYMRFDLAGSSYKRSSDDTANTLGASISEPLNCNDDDTDTTRILCGYELTKNLDFDTDGDGTFSVTNEADCDVILQGDNPETKNITETSYPRTDYEACLLDTDDQNTIYFNIAEDGSGGWLPIGDKKNPFTAIFDGNDFTISNMSIKINSDSFLSIGFFGDVASSSVIQNIGLVESKVISSARDADTGGLVGINNGDINRSYLTGSISVSCYYAVDTGGLVGSNYGRINHAYFIGDISVSCTSSSSAGGLVGGGGGISDSYAMGNISVFSSTSTSVGGLAGSGSDINDSYAIVDVFSATIANSSSIGGLLGHSANGSISHSYATGNVSSKSIRGAIYAGGLVGYHNNSNNIHHSYANGEVLASSLVSVYSGGLVGVNYSSVNTSYATGNVSCLSSANYDCIAGGLVGVNKKYTSSSVADSYATGAVSAVSSESSISYAGGLVGFNEQEGSIKNSIATGNVSSKSGIGGGVYAGGLVAFSEYYSSIINNISTGNVSSISERYSYASGLVTARYNVVLINNYRNSSAVVTSIQTEGNGGTTSTGTEASIDNFQDPTWYTADDRWNTTEDNTAWDFTNIWQIVDGEYPTLRK